MATQAQYEVFKYVHDEESKRLAELVTRAKVYLSIATFFLGALGFKVGDAIVTVSPVAKIAFLLAALSFIVAFTLIILSLRVYSYEGICDLEEVIDTFGDEPPEDGGFLDDRIVDLAVACNRNSELNDKRADLLQWASYAMLIGIVTVFMSFVLGAALMASQTQGGP